MNRILKWTIIIVVGLYAIVVIGFESLLGYYQPQNDGTMVITTYDEGEPHPRVVSRIETNDNLYVAVNHWPRFWYWDILDNPEVTVEIDGESDTYIATELEGDAYDKVDAARPLSLTFRFLTGFPPRRILRLDPMPTPP